MLGEIPDVVPSITFGKKDDEKKKAVAQHWDIFCGHTEEEIHLLKAANADVSSPGGNQDGVSEDEIRK